MSAFTTSRGRDISDALMSRIRRRVWDGEDREQIMKEDLLPTMGADEAKEVVAEAAGLNFLAQLNADRDEEEQQRQMWGEEE